MAGWREQKKALTRSRLAAAAAELLLTQGDEATTVAAIAQQADVSTRTFHNYFARREDAFLEFLRDVIRGWAESIADAPSDTPLLDVMREVYRAAVHQPLESLDSPLSLMMVAQHVAMMLAPENRAEAYRILAPVEEAISDRAPELGDFEVSLFLDLVFAATGGALRHAIMRFGEDHENLAEEVDARLVEAFDRLAEGFGRDFGEVGDSPR